MPLGMPLDLLDVLELPLTQLFDLVEPLCEHGSPAFLSLLNLRLIALQDELLACTIVPELIVVQLFLLRLPLGLPLRLPL